MLDVLIVDDDEETRRTWTLFLRQSGLKVEAEASAFGALRRLERERVLVVVSDEEMAGPSGVALLGTVRRRWERTGRVLFTCKAGVERDALSVEALLLRKGDRPGDIRRAIIAEVQDAERRYAIPA